MNIFIRFFYHFIISRFNAKIDINQSDECLLRVYPNDLDLNFHMNNGRFLSLMDIGRMRLSIRSGLHKKAMENNWGFGVVGGINITYFKSLNIFQSFKLKSKLAGHCDGWFFIEQRIESKGRLICAALVKVIFLSEGKKVSVEKIIKTMNVDDIGENKDYLDKLFNSETEFLDHIKKQY
jgi:acyl-CoA thioesterase FadM